MGFTEEYLALRKKRQQEEALANIDGTKKKTTTTKSKTFEEEYAELRQERLAEANNRRTAAGLSTYDDGGDLAPTKSMQDEDDGKKWYEGWFQKGAFEDGYQFGDVFRTVEGTSRDIYENVMAGILGIGEAVVDAGAYATGAVGGLFSEDFKDKTADFIAKDLYDEKAVAKKIIGMQPNLSNLWADSENSVLDDKSDSVAQSGGQLLGTVALQAAGVPWYLTTGATSFGSATEQALDEGATYGEAGLSAAITAGAEILTEKMFGGSGLGEKGLINLDKLTAGISNKAAKALLDFGIDIAAEGSEEVFSQIISNLGTALYKEENLMDILASEDAVNEYIESFIGGAVLGGGANVGNLVSSVKTGTDYRNGLTSDEQKVFDHEYESRVKEAEDGGEKLTAKEKSKIHDEVMKDLENGYISTDTIESVLGGETYQAYKDAADNEDALRSEYESLADIKKSDLTTRQETRLQEIQQQLAEIKQNNTRDTLKSKLSDEVMTLTQGSKLSESYNQRGQRGVAFEADVTKYDAKQQTVIQKAIDSGILNNTRRTHEFVDMVAKISADKGVSFDFANNAKLKESGFAVDGATVNGYVTADGVTVNIDSAKSLNSVVGHEITHVLEGTEIYTELQSVIAEYAKTKGEYDTRRASLAELYKDMKDADIDAELTADLVGDYLFTDSDFVRNLSVKNRNLFQKLYDEIKYLVKVATAGSKEARELEKVKRAFDKAYKESGKAVEGVKNSLSDTDGKQLTSEQQEYFANSKMRDDAGNLKVMYHGSQDAGFHVFDPSMSDDGTSLFFVDRNDVAASYSGTSETYAAKTIRSAEDMNNFLAEIGYDQYTAVEKNGKFELLENGEHVAWSDTAQGIYDEFTWYEGVGEGDANYKVYLNLTNPLVIDANGRNWNNISREFSQEIADRYHSLTADEKAALTDLAEWGEYSIFRDEILSVAKSMADGKVDDSMADLASAYTKLGGANSNLYDAFSIAQDDFSEESIKQFAAKQMNTRDYAKKAKADGYDGVIFKNLHDNGGYSNGSEGASTVAIAFSSEQVKSVANDKPTGNPDIRYSLSEDGGAYADTFYSHMAKVVDGVKQEKLGAESVVNMLRGKGVKAEEIKWSGIEAFLDGKKSVTKKELQEFIAGNQLQIEEQELSETVKFTDEHRKQFTEINAKNDKLWDDVTDEWHNLFGDGMIPVDLMLARRPSLYAEREFSKSGIPLDKGERLISLCEEIEANNDLLAKVADEARRDSQPAKWGDYKLDGGDNYREYLFKLPGSKYSNAAMETHWGETTGVLAHARVQDIETKDGRNMLFIEEIQSDWHNAGQKNGYRATGKRTFSEISKESDVAYEKFYKTVEKMLQDKGYDAHPAMLANLFYGDESAYKFISDPEMKLTESELDYIKSEVGKEKSRRNELQNAPAAGAAPDAPFRGNYHEYVLKRLIREAAEKGYDSIGWTTADMQSERWSDAYAEGYRIEYDQDIPKFLNKYGKKWGAAVGKEYLKADDSRVSDLEERLADTESELAQYEDELLDDPTEDYAEFIGRVVEDLRHTADALRDELRGTEIWSMPITPAMKQSVLYEGQPMYSISKTGKRGKKYGNYNVYGEDVRLDVAPAQAENVRQNAQNARTENATDVAPVLPDEPSAETFDTAAENDRVQSLTDADMPPEMDAPYYGEEAEVTVDDPFESRDIKEVGSQKVKAYMYENPEVKPYFQSEANVLLGELRDSTKGERFYTETPDGQAGVYGAESYGVWTGVKRHVSPDIEYLLDGANMSYADIEKGLKAIIEDHGAENIAAAKKIEFVLNDRLMKGYQDWQFGTDIPPNQEYIHLLNEKQITEYNEEAFTRFMESADQYAPPAEDIAPVAKTTQRSEAITPQRVTGSEPSMKRVDNSSRAQQATEQEAKVAEVMVGEPEVAKKQRGGWQAFRRNFLDKYSVFEDLALKTKNRELDAKANFIRYAESAAQHFIGKGAKGVKSLNAIREEVTKTGKTKQFYDYMYHLHNVDRMSLEGKAQPITEGLKSKFANLREDQIKAIAAKEITNRTTERTAATIRDAREYLRATETKNKPVFGETVTAEVSQKIVRDIEATNPEFKGFAKDVYDYMNHLRSRMVSAGIISQETAALWSEMYPHYVPIRRLGHSGLGVNVPLDTGKTGVNAPIKRATGGNSDIMDMFDTMAMRTEQTFRAIAKNSFGVELKNTLGTTIEKGQMSLDDAIDGVERHEELLKKGENGANPTFTVFEGGERVEFEITEEMYNALKPTNPDLLYKNKVANTASEIHRGILTEYNPVFMVTNAIKDAQDILMNSQHPARTYANMPNAFLQLVGKGKWYQEYIENGGEQNTYFDGQAKTFKEDNAFKKVVGIPLRAISAANNFVERAPRLAEYMASRKAGRSVEVAMLDAARVTTNFAAGGDVTKAINRNGATFLNASVQGFNQQVRNVREAKANGLKGWTQLAAKTIVAGIPALLLNNLLWEDDEEYEELSDYVKDNYYVVAKYGDGKFVRIPKGRTVAVIQDAFEQISNAITGDDEVDLENFLKLAISNLAPNSPIDNNILAPIMQVKNNKAWYGDDILPTRLQDLPAAEQYDESTDAISKWLGEKAGEFGVDISPYMINYVLNQYSGGVGDVVLPMLTPEAERGDNTAIGNILAPFKDKFTTDSVMNNQNVSDFYDTVDELAKNANSMYATDEDILKYKYMNSVNAELGELYQSKREIQNGSLSDADKYDAVRDIQAQIDEITRDSLATYGGVAIDGGYATVGDRHYRMNNEGAWEKITDKQLEKQNEVTSSLGISPSEYWGNKEEYDFAYENPGKYAMSKTVGGYSEWKNYNAELNDIFADKDEDGKSISGSRKENVLDYINGLDLDYGQRIILYRSEYGSKDDRAAYNADILDYLNSRQDISYEDTVTILKELGFTVDANGNVFWD